MPSALEVAVLGAVLLLHSLERAHAAIALELSAVEDDGVAGAFLCSGNQRAYHHRASAGSEGLDNVTRVAQSAIGNQGYARTFECFINIVDGAELRHTHTCYHASGADAARTICGKAAFTSRSFSITPFEWP